MISNFFGIPESTGNSATRLSHKRGFTLMELMVYCGLIGIIVLVAGQAYSDSVKFRVRSEAMVKSSSEANAAATLLQEDLSQMGAKASFEDGSTFEFHTSVYNNVDDDSASYQISNTHDSISFKRLTYNSQGQAEFLQQITWQKINNQLFRICKTLDKFLGTAAPQDCKETQLDTILIANDVSEFQLQPGRRLQDASHCIGNNFSAGCFTAGSVFTLASMDESGVVRLLTKQENASIQIEGFWNNYGTTENFYSQLYFLNGSIDSPNWQQCTPFTFVPNVTYAVAFKILVPNDAEVNYMRNFQPEYDHIGVGFRKNNGESFESVEDYLVYPAQKDEDDNRYFEFSFPERIENACLTFTFSFYSKHAASGFLEISDLQVFPRDESVFDFNDPGDDTKLHKAFKLTFSVNVRGEKTTIERIITTPNNGI